MVVGLGVVNKLILRTSWSKGLGVVNKLILRTSWSIFLFGLPCIKFLEFLFCVCMMFLGLPSMFTLLVKKALCFTMC